MKQILLFISLAATATLPSCSAIPSVKGRIITKRGDLTFQPDGSFEITVHPTK
jgi:hypothetical protein